MKSIPPHMMMMLLLHLIVLSTVLLMVNAGNGTPTYDDDSDDGDFIIDLFTGNKIPKSSGDEETSVKEESPISQASEHPNQSETSLPLSFHQPLKPPPGRYQKQKSFGDNRSNKAGHTQPPKLDISSSKKFSFFEDQYSPPKRGGIFSDFDNQASSSPFDKFNDPFDYKSSSPHSDGEEDMLKGIRGNNDWMRKEESASSSSNFDRNKKPANSYETNPFSWNKSFSTPENNDDNIDNDEWKSKHFPGANKLGAKASDDDENENIFAFSSEKEENLEKSWEKKQKEADMTSIFIKDDYLPKGFSAETNRVEIGKDLKAFPSCFQVPHDDVGPPYGFLHRNWENVELTYHGHVGNGPYQLYSFLSKDNNPVPQLRKDEIKHIISPPPEIFVRIIEGEVTHYFAPSGLLLSTHEINSVYKDKWNNGKQLIPEQHNHLLKEDEFIKNGYMPTYMSWNVEFDKSKDEGKKEANKSQNSRSLRPSPKASSEIAVKTAKPKQPFENSYPFSEEMLQKGWNQWNLQQQRDAFKKSSDEFKEKWDAWYAEVRKSFKSKKKKQNTLLPEWLSHEEYTNIEKLLPADVLHKKYSMFHKWWSHKEQFNQLELKQWEQILGASIAKIEDLKHLQSVIEKNGQYLKAMNGFSVLTLTVPAEKWELNFGSTNAKCEDFTQLQFIIGKNIKMLGAYMNESSPVLTVEHRTNILRMALGDAGRVDANFFTLRAHDADSTDLIEVLVTMDNEDRANVFGKETKLCEKITGHSEVKSELKFQKLLEAFCSVERDESFKINVFENDGKQTEEEQIKSHAQLLYDFVVGKFDPEFAILSKAKKIEEEKKNNMEKIVHTLAHSNYSTLRKIFDSYEKVLIEEREKEMGNHAKKSGLKKLESKNSKMMRMGSGKSSPSSLNSPSKIGRSGRFPQVEQSRDDGKVDDNVNPFSPTPAADVENKPNVAAKIETTLKNILDHLRAMRSVNKESHFLQTVESLVKDVYLGRAHFFADLLQQKVEKIFDGKSTNDDDAHKDIQRILLTRSYIDLPEIVHILHTQKTISFKKNNKTYNGLLTALREIRNEMDAVLGDVKKILNVVREKDYVDMYIEFIEWAESRTRNMKPIEPIDV